MRLRFCLTLALIFLWSPFASARAASPNGDGSSEAVGKAEAGRLYERANDFVTNIAEGDYSYAYMQFFWKRAQSNLDRVLRVYPTTPTAQALKSGRLKIGPFETGYFKERVLPALEEKKLNAFDAVNCAIFLYNRDEQRQDQTRRAALQDILEVLSRQKRWGEALMFPGLRSGSFSATIDHFPGCSPLRTGGHHQRAPRRHTRRRSEQNARNFWRSTRLAWLAPQRHRHLARPGSRRHR